MKVINAKKNRYFAYRSFWPEIETMKKFRECGVDTFVFLVSNVTNSLGFPYTQYPPVWKWNNVYDLDAFDRQIGDILRAIPDAKLMCLVDLNTPQWWIRYLGALGVKYDSFYELGKISASQTFRRDAADYMQTILRHAEKNYSKHMVAYMLGCGCMTEWHDRSRGEESIYRLAEYRKWQKQQGLPETDIPGRLQRDLGSYDFDADYLDDGSYYNGMDPTGCIKQLFPEGPGLMRTPEKNKSVLDYWRFCNEFNADTVKYFLGLARPLIRKDMELGVFFGYGFSSWTIASTGHLAYERLLDAGELDFVMAPIGAGHEMGGGSTSATVRETIRLKGKRMLHEMDQRTNTYNRKMSDCCELPDPLKSVNKEVKWSDPTDSKEQAKKFAVHGTSTWVGEEEVAAGIKRDSIFSLINGDSLWWFDMWGGFYQGKKVYAALKAVKKIWDEQSDYETADVSEILLVLDPENMYLINDLNPRCGTFQYAPLVALSKCGMPYSVCSFNDMQALDMSRFKVVIMCHPFELGDGKRRFLEDHLFKGQRSIVWMYGPGVVNRGKWDPDNVRTICGTSFGTDGINTVNRGRWKSVYIHRPERITTEIIRSIAVDAGCHLYCSTLRPVYANERLIGTHTALREKMAINLRQKTEKVTELFSGKTWRNTDRVELESAGPDTFLLLLEAASKGRKSS